MMTVATFIGGPWDGQKASVPADFPPPIFEIAELGEVEGIGDIWGDVSAVESVLNKAVPIHRVRYHLYDNWPVKYLVEGLK